MSTVVTNPEKTIEEKGARPLFQYLIVIQPLGFLYGSAGNFLSPENLVGRSGSSFPPSAAALSGVFAAHYNSTETNDDDKKKKLKPLQVAGPFWGFNEELDNFLVPTPFNCLVEMKRDGEDEENQVRAGQVQQKIFWHTKDQKWLDQNYQVPKGKFFRGSWIKINDWHKVNSEQWQDTEVFEAPWHYVPYLHPQLEKQQRRVDAALERGSLFLENAVALHPDTCIVYLANDKLPYGWYRFGGEGHMVNLEWRSLSFQCQELLENGSLSKSFALVTPAIWGSNRLSEREPIVAQTNQKAWQVEAMLTERPSPYRYRLGKRSLEQPLEEVSNRQPHKPGRLSRGRYAVPAGTVYVLKKPFELENTWQKWPDSWFPKEAYSFKRWGCGLALPLDNAIA
ncbi:MAG: type III-B CRISPR module-associated Cmr3 family protein [Cyanophyceae cyanobacterium]